MPHKNVKASTKTDIRTASKQKDIPTYRFDIRNLCILNPDFIWKKKTYAEELEEKYGKEGFRG